MDEEEVVEQYEATNVTDDVNIDEPITPIEVVEEEDVVVDVIEGEDVVVEIDSAFPSLGQINETMNHALMNNRDLHDQHPIGAITGLQGELDYIKSLKTVYSNKIGCANYFLWEDGNLGHDNRVGYFVSLCPNKNEIKLYDGTNVFGVVVSDAAFVGGQDDISRDDKYGLIIHSGVAPVRCETNVTAGDYIIPNIYGVAEKTINNCGYKVASMMDVHGNPFAVINLDIPIEEFCDMVDDVVDVVERMGVAETNIISAINVANQAYKKATNVDELSQSIKDIVEDTVKEVADSVDIVNSFEDRLTNVQIDTEITRATVESALNNTNAAIEETNNSLVEANEELQKLWNEVGPSGSIADIKQKAEDNETSILQIVGSLNVDLTYDSVIYDRYLNYIDEELTENPGGSWRIEKYIIVPNNKYTYSRVGDNSSGTAYAAFYNSDGEVIGTPFKVSLGKNVVTAPNDATYVRFSIHDSDNFILNGAMAISAIKSKVDSNEAAITNIVNWTGENGSTIAEIKQKADNNEASIQSMVSYVHKYIVGEYSQSYGLSFEEMKPILTADMVYVPTKDHKEQGFVKADDGSISTIEFEFKKEYSYTRDASNTKWIESNTPNVSFSDVYIEGSSSVPYWYIPGESNVVDENSGITYEAYTLYKWGSGMWNAVATLAGSFGVRNISLVRQTADAISAEITDARGSATSIAERLNENEASISQVATWKTDVEKNVAAISTKADASGASVAQVVSSLGQEIDADNIENETYLDSKGRRLSSASDVKYASWNIMKFTNINSGCCYVYSGISKLEDENGCKSYISLRRNGSHSMIDGKSGSNAIFVPEDVTEIWFGIHDDDLNNLKLKEQVDAASIVTAINKSESSVFINADHISLNGSCINLTSNNISIESTHFNVASDGTVTATNAILSGKITATSGNIGGWEVGNIYQGSEHSDHSALYKTIWSTDDNKYYTVAIQSAPEKKDFAFVAYYGSAKYDGNSVGRSFYVLNDGTLFANNATISGNITATSGEIGGWTIGHIYPDSETSKPSSSYSSLYRHSYSDSMIYTTAIQSAPGTRDFAFVCYHGPISKNAYKYDPTYCTSTFYVLNDGTLYATGANISGHINATSGTIGGCTISNETLIVGDANISGVNISKLAAGVNNNAIELSNLKATGGQICNVDGKGWNIGSWNSSSHISGNTDNVNYPSLSNDATWKINGTPTSATIYLTPYYVEAAYGSGHTVSTWNKICAAGNANGSDSRIKDNISNINEIKLEVFFDKLSTKTFIYKETSGIIDGGKTHIGFVAQDVLQALKEAEIDNSALVEQYEYYSLRYHEFIALNTWQIQKLKARVAELEEKIKEIAG